jgi:hypothetical protein
MLLSFVKVLREGLFARDFIIIPRLEPIFRKSNRTNIPTFVLTNAPSQPGLKTFTGQDGRL